MKRVITLCAVVCLCTSAFAADDKDSDKSEKDETKASDRIQAAGTVWTKSNPLPTRHSRRSAWFG